MVIELSLSPPSTAIPI